MQRLLRPNELSFIAEYVTVMQPLANALDILQGEQKCFLGVLLPTIVCLKNKLIQCKSSMKFTASLVDSILAGISNRFDSLLTKKEMILAAVVHPQFKLRWLHDDADKFSGKAILLEAMKKAEVEMAETSTRNLLPSVDDGDTKIQTSTQSVSDDDFFTLHETEPESVASSALAEMEMFLTDGLRGLSSLYTSIHLLRRYS